VDVGQPDVALQVGERPGAGVEPEVEARVPDQVPARRRVCVRPGPARAQNGQLHVDPLGGDAGGAVTPSTGLTSTPPIPPTCGPRKCWATTRNCSGSPVVRNSCRGSVGSVLSRSADTSVEYTSLAVSSAEETKTTSSPMTTWMRPESIG